MLLILSIVLCSGFALGKIPSDITRCRIPDDNCLAKSIEYVVRKYTNGHRDLNLDSIDPLKIQEMSIIQGSQSPVRIDLIFKNLLLTGVKEISIRNISLRQDERSNFRFDAVVKFPLLTLDSDYMVDGSVLILPITGKGRSLLTFRNVVAQVKFLAVPVVKNGKHYIKIERFKLSFTTDRLTVNFQNLFNGDKVLGDTMNQFINENWKDIFEEMKPAVTDNLKLVFREIFMRVFNKIPITDLFLLDDFVFN